MGLLVALETGTMSHTKYWSRTKPTARRLLYGSEIIALGAVKMAQVLVSLILARKYLVIFQGENSGRDC